MSAGIYRITHRPTGWRYIGASKNPALRLKDHQRHLLRCVAAPLDASGWVRRLWALLLLQQHDGSVLMQYRNAIPDGCTAWWRSFYMNKATRTQNGLHATEPEHIICRWEVFAIDLPPLHRADFDWQVVEWLPCHGPTLQAAELRWAAIGSELNPTTHKRYGNHSGRWEDLVAMGWR